MKFILNVDYCTKKLKEMFNWDFGHCKFGWLTLKGDDLEIHGQEVTLSENIIVNGLFVLTF